MDLDGFLERTASDDGFSRDSTRAGDNDSLHDARVRGKISSQQFHDKEASALLCMRACTSAYAFFAESVHAFRLVFWAPCMHRCVRWTGVVNISVHIC